MLCSDSCTKQIGYCYFSVNSRSCKPPPRYVNRGGIPKIQTCSYKSSIMPMADGLHLGQLHRMAADTYIISFMLNINILSLVMRFIHFLRPIENFILISMLSHFNKSLGEWVER